MPLALSTSWNAFRHRSGTNIAKEINQLGFRHIELSFNLTPHILKGLAQGSRKLGLRINSLHNYCPIPSGFSRKEALPDCYSLASLDKEERSIAVKYTKLSIDTAARLNSSAVVLHCGRVQIEDRTKALIRLYREGCLKTKDFTSLKSEYIKERELKGRPYFFSALKSIDELGCYADKKKIKLGIETRFYYREIPCFDEISEILNRFRGSNIGYWHDTGHAQLLEDLSFSRHKDFLDSYSGRMIGIHLHDIKNCQDHLCPGQGKINFSFLRRYLRKETLKVIEAHYPASPENLSKAKEYLENELKGLL